MKISVDAILPNPEQPRKEFSPIDLKELAESIRINSLVLAIAVEEAGNGMYYILDGERRWRAHKLLGLKEIEATVHPPQANGEDRLIKAMVANMHREDLTPIEEAKAYKRLLDLRKTLNTVSHVTGVSFPKITSRLKLLTLEPEIQDLVNAGKLPTDLRSTEAILSIRKPEDQVKIATRLARPGIRIKTIVQACQQYNKMVTKPLEKLNIPALDVAREKAQRMNSRTDPGKLPAWSILKQTKQLPPWELYQAAANETCKACTLSDFASEDTCKDCPAVELTLHLLEAADEHR